MGQTKESDDRRQKTDKALRADDGKMRDHGRLRWENTHRSRHAVCRLEQNC